MKKKVYLVGPHKGLRGGISTVINQLMNSNYLKGNYCVHHIPTVKNNKLIDYLKAVIKTFKIEKGSIVHIHMASNGSFYRKAIILKLINKNTKTVIHIHGGYFGDFYKKGNCIVKTLIKNTLKKADAIICVSNSLKNEIKNIVPENNIEVIYNSITVTNNTVDLQLKENTIVFMGKLAEYKGIYDLLECLASIRQTIMDSGWNIVIAGNGEIDKVRELVKQYNIDEIVEIKGWVEGKDKEDILQKGKILVMPSYIESFGISCVEAMNYGLAIICSNVGGLPEIVTNENGLLNGLLISPGDKEELKKSIIKLIEEEHTINSMAKNNIERAKQFKEENMIISIDKIYKVLSD